MASSSRRPKKNLRMMASSSRYNFFSEGVKKILGFFYHEICHCFFQEKNMNLNQVHKLLSSYMEKKFVRAVGNDLYIVFSERYSLDVLSRFLKFEVIKTNDLEPKFIQTNKIIGCRSVPSHLTKGKSLREILRENFSDFFAVKCINVNCPMHHNKVIYSCFRNMYDKMPSGYCQIDNNKKSKNSCLDSSIDSMEEMLTDCLQDIENVDMTQKHIDNIYFRVLCVFVHFYVREIAHCDDFKNSQIFNMIYKLCSVDLIRNIFLANELNLDYELLFAYMFAVKDFRTRLRIMPNGYPTNKYERFKHISLFNSVCLTCYCYTLDHMIEIDDVKSVRKNFERNWRHINSVNVVDAQILRQKKSVDCKDDCICMFVGKMLCGMQKDIFWYDRQVNTNVLSSNNLDRSYFNLMADFIETSYNATNIMYDLLRELSRMVLKATIVDYHTSGVYQNYLHTSKLESHIYERFFSFSRHLTPVPMTFTRALYKRTIAQENISNYKLVELPRIEHDCISSFKATVYSSAKKKHEHDQIFDFFAEKVLLVSHGYTHRDFAIDLCVIPTTFNIVNLLETYDKIYKKRPVIFKKSIVPNSSSILMRIDTRDFIDNNLDTACIFPLEDRKNLSIHYVVIEERNDDIDDYLFIRNFFAFQKFHKQSTASPHHFSIMKIARILSNAFSKRDPQYLPDISNLMKNIFSTNVSEKRYATFDELHILTKCISRVLASVRFGRANARSVDNLLFDFFRKSFCETSGSTREKSLQRFIDFYFTCFVNNDFDDTKVCIDISCIFLLKKLYSNCEYRKFASSNSFLPTLDSIITIALENYEKSEKLDKYVEFYDESKGICGYDACSCIFAFACSENLVREDFDASRIFCGFSFARESNNFNSLSTKPSCSWTRKTLCESKQVIPPHYSATVPVMIFERVLKVSLFIRYSYVTNPVIMRHRMKALTFENFIRDIGTSFICQEDSRDFDNTSTNIVLLKKPCENLLIDVVYFSNFDDQKNFVVKTPFSELACRKPLCERNTEKDYQDCIWVCRPNFYRIESLFLNTGHRSNYHSLRLSTSGDIENAHDDIKSVKKFEEKWGPRLDQYREIARASIMKKY